MSDKTRERAAAQAIAEQDRRRLNTFHEAQARDALSAADANDTANGVHRVTLDDATVERAASVLAMKSYTTAMGIAFDDYKRVARAALAAAVDVP